MYNWLSTNKLICIDYNCLENNAYTYFKNDITSWIDHIVSNENDNVKNIKVLSSKWNCGDHLAITGTIETASTVEKNQFENKRQTKSRIIWNEKSKRIYYEKLQLLLNELSDSLPAKHFQDNKLLLSSLEKLLDRLNNAILESAKEITEENLITKHKMKINGWWDLDIKVLYNEYYKAKKEYRNN
ncbi:unnamed protein product, partial [Brachionus calyciflorus]